MTDREIRVRIDVIYEQIVRIFNDLAFDKRIAEMKELNDIVQKLFLFWKKFEQAEEECEDSEEEVE